MCALIIAAFILTATLTACKFSIGNKETDSGDLSNFVVGGSSKPDTSSKTDPTNSTQPPKSSDPATLKALAGSWSKGATGRYIDFIEMVTFNEDGTFENHGVYANKTTITTPGGNKETAYKISDYVTKGKFRVKGAAIDFYDKVSGVRETFKSNPTKWDDAWSALSEVSVKEWNPVAKDTKWEFEFTGDGRIMIRTADLQIDYFKWASSGSHSVNLPEIKIPSLEWPAAALPGSLPAYTGEGRIIRILYMKGMNTGTPDDFTTVQVNYDITTEAACREYLAQLKADGWEITEYLVSQGQPTVTKGDIKLYFGIEKDNFYISYRTPK